MALLRPAAHDADAFLAMFALRVLASLPLSVVMATKDGDAKRAVSKDDDAPCSVANGDNTTPRVATPTKDDDATHGVATAQKDVDDATRDVANGDDATQGVAVATKDDETVRAVANGGDPSRTRPLDGGDPCTVQPLDGGNPCSLRDFLRALPQDARPDALRLNVLSLLLATHALPPEHRDDDQSGEAPHCGELWTETSSHADQMEASIGNWAGARLAARLTFRV